MTKKRKMSAYSPPKIEVKEENIMGNDYLMAKGRLKGVLRQLTERSESDSNSSDEAQTYNSRRLHRETRKRKLLTQPAPLHHTYVMKLFDRSVDLARFEEDTPLYPICRAWMANLPRNPQVIVKRRKSTPEPESNMWNGDSLSEIHRLPPPSEPYVTRVPSPLPEQTNQAKDAINLNYDEKSAVPRDVLIRNHLHRWVNVKRKWIATSRKNEERYERSTQILHAIYTKAQEGLE